MIDDWDVRTPISIFFIKKDSHIYSKLIPSPHEGIKEKPQHQRRCPRHRWARSHAFVVTPPKTKPTSQEGETHSFSCLCTAHFSSVSHSHLRRFFFFFFFFWVLSEIKQYVEIRKLTRTSQLQFLLGIQILAMTFWSVSEKVINLISRLKLRRDKESPFFGSSSKWATV